MTYRYAPMRRSAAASRNLLAALALVACAPEAGARPSPADTALGPEQHFELALEAQTARGYNAMLIHLRAAASRGHVQAQEHLGIVLLAGPTIYGRAVQADRCEALTWFLAAAHAGSAYGRTNLVFLNRTRNAPHGRRACGD